ncbi:CPBP family intramembrane glutamic endopeptidase [Kribbella sp. NPDC056951]|uniref:CPBP family intramembrane glutamic endopeptidase n=1 Tax=Kribbella sp. NPDC056951 TaxID=3345978 RepID=UPI0036355B6F
MTITHPAAPAPAPQIVEPATYDQLARVTGRHDWWRPIVGTFVLLGLSIVAEMWVFGQFESMAASLDLPKDADGFRILSDLSDTALTLAGIALGIPALALTVWWIQRRTLGSVTSVTGRLRLSWLGRCFALAVLALGLSMVAMGVVGALIEPESTSEETWVGWGTFAVTLVTLLCLVPLQAAAEEFIFRGWLLQATGSFLRNPILIVIPQALLFGAAHGWGTVWGFIDLVVFGVVVGLVTIRTGGLEAAIALHVTNNLTSFIMSSTYVGGLGTDETAADMPWQYAVVDMAVIVLFAVLILQLAKRYKPAVNASARIS